jgi:hypothetical protein
MRVRRFVERVSLSRASGAHHATHRIAPGIGFLFARRRRQATVPTAYRRPATRRSSRHTVTTAS